jgi:hypothetical protein
MVLLDRVRRIGSVGLPGALKTGSLPSMARRPNQGRNEIDTEILGRLTMREARASGVEASSSMAVGKLGGRN